MALYLNKLESPLPKDVLSQVWLRLAHARELRPVSRINVNKYTIIIIIFCRLCIHEKKKKREKMCNQCEVYKVYFYYACVKYDVISYMKSPCCDE